MSQRALAMVATIAGSVAPTRAQPATAVTGYSELSIACGGLRSSSVSLSGLLVDVRWAAGFAGAAEGVDIRVGGVVDSLSLFTRDLDMDLALGLELGFDHAIRSAGPRLGPRLAFARGVGGDDYLMLSAGIRLRKGAGVAGLDVIHMTASNDRAGYGAQLTAGLSLLGRRAGIMAGVLAGTTVILGAVVYAYVSSIDSLR